MRSAALVNQCGEIDFCCFPEFDSPSIFASLLDTGSAGSFAVRPAGGQATGTQLYVPGTNVLLTRFQTEETVLEVSDWMSLKGSALGHSIVRSVAAVRGDITVEVLCRPAFDYARVDHSLEQCSNGVVFRPSSSSQLPLRLLSDVDLTLDGQTARAMVELKAGSRAYFVLGTVDTAPGADMAALVEADRIRTVDYWKEWIGKSIYKGRWNDAVTRSALSLKLLTSEEHGSLIAAPTFGLPESVGGPRNWDYRYTWIRDASFTSYAFNRLGLVEEGLRFNQWLRGRALEEGENGPLRVMYRLDGSNDLDERVLEHLAGYQGSKPVRIGNAAASQLQLDIYGELFDSIYLSSKYGDAPAYESWLRMKEVLRWLAQHWRDADEGIWEVRGGRREFLHSRVMCWVAFDRAIRLGGKRSLTGPFDWMEQCRDAIVEDVHEHFWQPDLGFFVQSKGSREIDASVLLMPLVRFISPSDPRWLSTLRAVEEKLVVETEVMRYSSGSSVDGLGGRESGFTACAFWLVEALARSHQVDKALLLFEKLLSLASPLGLYSEELTRRGSHLGNFPQALSHLALISAASYLDRALDHPKMTPWA